jgi:hypothetical protein
VAAATDAAVIVEVTDSFDVSSGRICIPMCPELPSRHGNLTGAHEEVDFAENSNEMKSVNSR